MTWKQTLLLLIAFIVGAILCDLLENIVWQKI